MTKGGMRKQKNAIFFWGWFFRIIGVKRGRIPATGEKRKDVNVGFWVSKESAGRL